MQQVVYHGLTIQPCSYNIRKRTGKTCSRTCTWYAVFPAATIIRNRRGARETDFRPNDERWELYAQVDFQAHIWTIAVDQL